MLVCSSGTAFGRVWCGHCLTWFKNNEETFQQYVIQCMGNLGGDFQFGELGKRSPNYNLPVVHTYGARIQIANTN